MSPYALSLGLIVIGFLLILAEIFIIPGFNVFGIGGFICIVIGISVAYDRLEPFAANMILVVSLALTVFIVWFFFKTGAYKRFILTDEQDKSAGYSAVSEDFTKYLHKIGIAITPLRPAGTASIEGNRIDVVTEGEFIETGKDIEVVKIEGNRIIVRQKNESYTA